MPEFDDAAEMSAKVERPRIAPAPDFSWTKPLDEEETAELSDEVATDDLVAEAPIAPEASAPVMRARST